MSMTIYAPDLMSVLCVRGEGDTAGMATQGTDCAGLVIFYVDYSVVYRVVRSLPHQAACICFGEVSIRGDFRQVWNHATVVEMNIINPLVELDRIAHIVHTSSADGINVKQCFSLLQSYRVSQERVARFGKLNKVSSDCVVEMRYVIEMLFCSEGKFAYCEQAHANCMYTYCGMEDQAHYMERFTIHSKTFDNLFVVLRQLRVITAGIAHLLHQRGQLPHATRGVISQFVMRLGHVSEYYLIEFHVPNVTTEILRVSELNFDRWREMWPGTATYNMLCLLFESEFMKLFTPFDIMPLAWHGEESSCDDYMFYGFNNVARMHCCQIVPGFRLFGKGYSGDVTGDGPSARYNGKSNNNNIHKHKSNNNIKFNNNSSGNKGKTNIKAMSTKSPANTSENKSLGFGKPSHSVDNVKQRTKYIRCEIGPHTKETIRGARGCCSFGRVAHYHPGEPKHNSGRSEGNPNAERRLVQKVMNDRNICFVRCEDISESCRAEHWHQLPSIAERSTSDQLDADINLDVERDADEAPDQNLPVNSVGLDAFVDIDGSSESMTETELSEIMDLVLSTLDSSAAFIGTDVSALVPTFNNTVTDHVDTSRVEWVDDGVVDEGDSDAEVDESTECTTLHAPTANSQYDFTRTPRELYSELPTGFLKIHQDLGDIGVLRLCTILYTQNVQRSYLEYFKDVVGLATCGAVSNVQTLGGGKTVTIGRETSFRWFWDVDLSDLSHVGERTRTGNVSSSMNYNLALSAGFVTSGEDYAYINVIDFAIKQCSFKTLVTGNGSVTSGALVTIRQVIRSEYPALFAVANTDYMLNTCMIVINQLVLNHTKFALCVVSKSQTTETHGLNY